MCPPPPFPLLSRVNVTISEDCLAFRGTGKHISTHVAGDDARLGVRGERDDSVPGLSQDGARFVTAQDALKERQRQKT